MSIVKDELTISDDAFKGTLDKKWGFGITWRTGIG